VTAPGIAITRQAVEAIRDMPASEQGLIIGRLVSEVSTARTVEKALYARRLLLTGRQVPEVYATEVAREHAQLSIEELDREIDSLLFETRVRKDVVSDTVATLLKRAAARRNASLTVPQASPIDPRPLTNGRGSSRAVPFRRSWFWGLSLLALGLVLAVGVVLWQAVELKSLGIEGLLRRARRAICGPSSSRHGWRPSPIRGCGKR
jgi:hypothetical protein